MFEWGFTKRKRAGRLLAGGRRDRDLGSIFGGRSSSLAICSSFYRDTSGTSLRNADHMGQIVGPRGVSF